MELARSTMAFAQINRCVIRTFIAASCISGIAAGHAVAQQPKPATVGITFKTAQVDPPKSDQPAPLSLPDLPTLPPLPPSGFGPVTSVETDKTAGGVKLTAASESSKTSSSRVQVRSTTVGSGKAIQLPAPGPDESAEPERMPNLPAAESVAAESVAAPALPSLPPPPMQPAPTLSLAPPPAPAESVAITLSDAGPAPQPERAPEPGPLKFTMGDEGVVDHGVQRTHAAPLIQQRAPELVKPTRHSSARVVAVAADQDPTQSNSASGDAKQSGAVSISLSGGDSRPSNIAIPAPPVPGRGANLSTANAGMPLAATPAIVASPAIMASESHPQSNAPQQYMGHYYSGDGRYPTIARTASDITERVHNLEVLGTLAIDAPFSVASASAKNSDICSVFHHGHTVTVVGNKPGNTTLEIRSSDNERRVVSVRIVPSGQKQASPSKDLEKVMEMIAEHFPDANLQFAQHDAGMIELRGTAASEADAKKILEIVRKVCLVPVKDRVQVRR